MSQHRQHYKIKLSKQPLGIRIFLLLPTVFFALLTVFCLWLGLAAQSGAMSVMGWAAGLLSAAVTAMSVKDIQWF